MKRPGKKTEPAEPPTPSQMVQEAADTYALKDQLLLPSVAPEIPSAEPVGDVPLVPITAEQEIQMHVAPMPLLPMPLLPTALPEGPKAIADDS